MKITSESVVYIVFKHEMHMPFMISSVIDVYSEEDSANTACASLNASNTNPMESDDYGPMNGTEYVVKKKSLR